MSIPANGLRGKYTAARLLKPSPFMLGFYHLCKRVNENNKLE